MQFLIMIFVLRIMIFFNGNIFYGMTYIIYNKV